MTRYLFGCLCVCALGAVPLIGCGDNNGGSGSGGSAGTGGMAGTGGTGGAIQEPGTLLLAEEIAPEEIDPLGRGIRGWRVLYTSEAVDGTPIDVSGIVVASSEPPGDGFRDVITFGNGTVGLFDACSVSDHIQSYNWVFNVMVPQLISQGYVYVASDYEGLGTPGIHPYHVGVSEGRGVLDIVRAARQIDDAYSGNRAVVWGISQGGHAALFAGEIAPEWAPDIEVLGVVAAAPTGDLESAFEALAGDPELNGYLWQITLSYEATYGLSLEDIYNPETLAIIRELADQQVCTDAFLQAASDVDNAGFVTNPADLSSWQESFTENSPGYVQSEMPILILQGAADVIVPQWETNILYDRLCNIDSQTDYRVFQGQNHVQSLTLHVADALEWSAARFAEEPASDTCPN